MEEKEKRGQKRKLNLNLVCPDCGDVLIWRYGRYGPFLGCRNYPVCTYSEKGSAEILNSATSSDDGAESLEEIFEGDPCPYQYTCLGVSMLQIVGAKGCSGPEFCGLYQTFVVEKRDG